MVMPGTRASTASRMPGGRSAAATVLISAAGPSASTDFSASAVSGAAGASALPHAARDSITAVARKICFRIVTLRSANRCQPIGDGERSEEHTSELQSLMRTSYAVFCLKKKKDENPQTHV